ncbi:MAG: RHS repeat-associated core domain-containing protein, partial [Verrucomicrobia bacterium]|nr:RHS repeat-associated core domain-containing protein [Verrucomicrobiota bacterium]
PNSPLEGAVGMHLKPDLPCDTQITMSKQTTTSHKEHQCVNRLTRSGHGRWKKHRTKYLYDGWNLIAEYSATMPIAEYIHGPNVDEMLAMATAGGMIYYSGDALNSTAALTDDTGMVIERYRYTAFGQPTILDPQSSILASSACGNRFAFHGREWFVELNLTDHRNRYYSPELQRWLNRDSLGEEGGVNLYLFVENLPVNEYDPFGLCPPGYSSKGTTWVDEWMTAKTQEQISTMTRTERKDVTDPETGKLRAQCTDYTKTISVKTPIEVQVQVEYEKCSNGRDTVNAPTGRRQLSQPVKIRKGAPVRTTSPEEAGSPYWCDECKLA